MSYHFFCNEISSPVAHVLKFLADNGFFIGGYGDDIEDRGVSIIVRDSSQIKSADPVTYDDEGNVIPLSERFKPEKNDIRYSLKDGSGEAYNRTIILNEGTIDHYLADYAAKGSPKYAQAYIAYMSPEDFISLTVSKQYAHRIFAESEGLDEKRLGEVSIKQPMYLKIDSKSGEVNGHEGRHRMAALARAGIERVPVLLFDYGNKYSKVRENRLVLEGQDFGNSKSDEMVAVHDLIPLNYENWENIIEKFSLSPKADEISGRSTVKYSLSGKKEKAFAKTYSGEVQTSDNMSSLKDADRRAIASTIKAGQFTFDSDGRRGWVRSANLAYLFERIKRNGIRVIDFRGYDEYNDYNKWSEEEYGYAFGENGSTDGANNEAGGSRSKDRIEYIFDVESGEGSERAYGVDGEGGYGASEDFGQGEGNARRDVGKKFSLKKPVEETDRFIALHNMSEEAMRGALELGGMAMPSVAMVRSETGHNTYGDISVVFGKDSVSPTDRRNRIFSGDAYTPTFPKVGYKISDKVSERLRIRIDDLLDICVSDFTFLFHLDIYTNLCIILSGGCSYEATRYRY